MTSNDSLMTSNDLKLKILQKYGFMYIKWKLVTQAIFKKTIEYITDLLMTPNDLKIENFKTTTLCISNES